MGPERKVEAGAPWAVWSASQAWYFCGIHSVTKVEKLRYKVNSSNNHRFTAITHVNLR